ncbi:hypothetical protein JIN85_07305 [Luteolibacter pohnpeiensis]|uniref:Uncharacterized protein n=1 Tax=Luteolibacter pohnpeiensis TaxID=454153 RepID=A0A934VVI4_9BACT|nr:hypothetical protein [Luteolibacter pohnpeiensis]MBK1882215.1 hypothetical protein [Luteolibacter pohnpeiensis]
MKLPLLLLAVFTGSLLAEEMPLPRWLDGEREQAIKDGWIAGDQILNHGLAADPELEMSLLDSLKPVDVAPPTPEDLAESDAPLDPVPNEFLDAYFENRPTQFLIDPQGLLNADESASQLGFLKYHAGDSAIDLFVYVFGKIQEIPSEVRSEEFVERLFSTGRPAAVVFYYLGDPQRSEMALSPELSGKIALPEQRRAMESSVLKTMAKDDPAAQLKAFTMQMSIRLYWMERTLEGNFTPATPAVAEVSPVPEKPVSARVVLEENVVKFLKDWGPVAGCVLFVAIGVLVLAIHWRRRAQFVFADLDAEPRLGASHAAGVGAVISFASANLPPARQRDQMPDYLRRA